MKKYRVKIDCPGFYKNTILTVSSLVPYLEAKIPSIDPVHYPEIFEEIKEEKKILVSPAVCRGGIVGLFKDDPRDSINPESNEMQWPMRVVLKNVKFNSRIEEIEADLWCEVKK